MIAAYFGRLSGDVQAFVQQVEESCGFEIAVRVVPGRTRLGSEIESQAATVLVPEDGAFPNASVWHEISHINRILVIGAPRLEVGDALIGHPTFSKALSELDNTIEHFFIVPQELQLYPARLAYWRERVTNSLASVAAMQPCDRESAALILYSMAVLGVGDAELIAAAALAVQSHSTVAKAELLVDRLRHAMPNKAEVMRVFAQEFELPDDAVELEFLDPATGAVSFEPLFEDQQ